MARAWPRAAMAAVGVVGVVTAAVATIVSNADKGQWAVLLLVVAGVVAALVPVASSRLEGSRQSRATIERLARGSAEGRLPLLGEIDLRVLGVRVPRTAKGSARDQLPYAGRHELDPRLRQALTRHRFVLVHGPSAAGKSRSSVQAARELHRTQRVVVPVPRTGALAALLDEGLVPAGAVVWLDDLDRHLGAGVDAPLVQRLLELPDVRVVATMRAAAYEQLKPQGELPPAGREVLDLAVLVPFTGWDQEDRVAASQQLAQDQRSEEVEGVEDVMAALGRGVGLGEYLSAGPELIERLESGAPFVPGVAVVRAAADWYRAGMARPAPLELVRTLYPHYLPADDVRLLDCFQQGLAWACTPVSGARLTTELTDGSGLGVHDYVLDHLASTLPAGLPAATWETLEQELALHPNDLTTVGRIAYLTHQDHLVAERYIRRAAAHGSARALASLGYVLLARGQLNEAMSWYRAAADAADADADVMNSLGSLLHVQRETDEAERWYRAAADAGSINAMNKLARLLQRRGETDEAEHWYRAADAAQRRLASGSASSD